MSQGEGWLVGSAGLALHPCFQGKRQQKGKFGRQAGQVCTRLPVELPLASCHVTSNFMEPAVSGRPSGDLRPAQVTWAQKGRQQLMNDDD